MANHFFILAARDETSWNSLIDQTVQPPFIIDARAIVIS